ncbi:MAG: LamB/YcsF family protein [Bacillales bacterium]|nr:LamB/YcsF family protein [Bacillales bacterium]
MFKVDLNCDMGESFGPYTLGNDKEMMNYISSANIACGFHAGDPNIMDQTVKLALEHNVSIGAHPGFLDLHGFGRRKIQITPEEAYQLIVYQVGALQGFVQANGGKLHHVKPHGALYNMAAVHKELAEAIALAIYRIDPGIVLYGLSNSELTKAGEAIGLKVAHEVFADRTYQQDGTLTPRNMPNALIMSEEAAIRQVVKMVKEQKVDTVDHHEISIQADTICLHGDGRTALLFAKRIHEIFQAEGIKIETV